MSNSSGVDYFFAGFKLIRTKGLKRFVFIPLTVNLLLFSIALYFLTGQIEAGIAWSVDLIPDFLGWLKDGLAYILWPLAVISVLLVFALFFGTLANWIAAPFNGLLAEKVELHLTGQSLGDTGVLDIVKDIPRTLAREFAKLAYYIPRAIGFLLLLFLLPVVGQVLWFLFSAWMMAIQYCDYAYDNHKVPFKTMRNSLNRSRSNSFGFGVMVSVFSMIPIVNFLVMPVSICGATKMWVEDLQHKL
jgi:CysZ protein